MDPEIKKALEALRAECGKNVEALARLDKIETAANEQRTANTTLRSEIESIKTVVEAQKKAFEDAVRSMRVQAAQTDPLREKRAAVEMLGMIGRQLLARHLGMPISARFQPEVKRVEEYMVQRATLAEGTGSGSYFIPTILEQEILDTLEEVSEILPLVDFKPGMPTKATIPTFTTRPTLQPKRAGTDTQMTASDPAFSYMSVDTEEAYIFFPVDNWLLELSPFALGSFLLPMLRDAYLDGLTKWVVLADGTATYNSLTGILNEATYVTNMPAGKTAFGDLTKANLTSIKAACLKRGRAKGVWLLSEEVLGLIEDIDRQGKTPLITYAQDGSPRIMQRPVVVDESMYDLADSAASKTVLAFGDLAAILVVMAGNGLQIATSTEFYFNRNQTCFRALGHIDIKRKPVNTLRVLKTAAS
jgi:HK97 family phage major capsid protein